MNINIPRVYNLHIRELGLEGNWIYGRLKINNFYLYINEDGYVYKISSNIKLNYLLDILYVYDDIFIKKLYYFLIIKYLLTLEDKIKWSSKIYQFIYGDCIFDKLINTRDIFITTNDKILITSKIRFNICLIINNRTLNKSLITIIDKNTDITNLDELMKDIYNLDRYEEIEIRIIGGGLDNMDKIINIYLILKKLRLAKSIKGTHIINHKKPLNRIKYNMYKNKIRIIDMNIPWECELNIDNHISNLHKICSK